MKALKNIVGIFLVVFLLFSLLKNIFNYKDKIKFYENYKQNFEEEKKKNIELKTEIVKKKSTTEVEKTIRNDLNLLKPDEIAIIIPSPTPRPVSITPTPAANYVQWWNLFFR